MCTSDISIPDSLVSTVENFVSEYYDHITQEYESRDSSIGWLNPVIEWTTEEAEDRDWEYHDDGGSRLIIKIPPTSSGSYTGPPLVLKLPIYRNDPRDGRYQNAAEANLWEKSPDELRPYLVPTLAYGRLYRWLLMPWADEASEEEIESKSWELVHEHGIESNEVLATENWGLWNGEARLIDYGHVISSFVLDEDEQVSVEDYAPEIPASYEELDNDENRNEDENQEESEDYPPADMVVVSSSGLIPAEKDEVRDELLDRDIHTGEKITANDDDEFEILSTQPSTDTAFARDNVRVSERTRIRFE